MMTTNQSDIAEVIDQMDEQMLTKVMQEFHIRVPSEGGERLKCEILKEFMGRGRTAEVTEVPIMPNEEDMWGQKEKRSVVEKANELQPHINAEEMKRKEFDRAM